MLGLADRIRPHLLVVGCTVGADACTLVMALYADAPLAAVPPRFATGAFLAGVYPVCRKLMASWSPRAGRALAMGALIGCLALGSALPHLIDGLGRLNWRAALTVAAPTAFSAAIIADALVRPGPQFLSGSGPDRRRHRLALRLPGPRRRTHERAARPDRPEPPDETERPAISNHRKDITMTSCWPSGPPAIGATAELSRTIGPDDVDRFTQISGDRNSLHYDPAAAKASRFG